MNNEKVLDKIKKLLALSQSPNEHEAQAAMLKAQELMKRYDISLEQSNEIEYEYLTVQGDNGEDNSYFRIPLANILAKNFRCKLYLRGNAIMFYGHSEDCEICKNVYDFAYKTIKRLSNRRYNEARKLGYSTKGFYTNYQNAFLIQLKHKFEKQCTALMIVTPRDVEDNFTQMTEGWKQSTRTFRNTGFNNHAYSQGTKDGKQFAEKI